MSDEERMPLAGDESLIALADELQDLARTCNDIAAKFSLTRVDRIT